MRYPVSKPCLGVREQHNVLEALQRVQLSQGEFVQRFEEHFAQLLGVKYAIACSSGTTALHLALVASGVGPDDEVIVPDLSFVATANAVTYTGAKPVLCDIDPETWALDPVFVERCITKKTRAIIVVHLYGRPADMLTLEKIADKHKLMLIEDAAQGLGGHYQEKPLGTIGHMGTFSFYGNKILTTGEGGMVITNSPSLAQLLRLFRGQGHLRDYYHVVVGFNYRMSELQGAVGLGQIHNYEDNLFKRSGVCAFYRDFLSELPFCMTRVCDAPWLFTVLLPDDVNRVMVRDYLLHHDIETRPTFVPMHLLPVYPDDSEKYPIAMRIGGQGISLPTYPDLTAYDVRTITTTFIEGVYRGRGSREHD